MKCWILYDESDLEGNRFFADKLNIYAKKSGFDSEIVLTKDVDVYDPADIVISRTRDSDLTSELEDNGATVFNRSSVSRICNDKAYTYSFVKGLGIPILPYSLPGQEPPPGPPWVVKSRKGHGGSEVFRANNSKDLDSLLSQLSGRDPLVQTFASDAGKDLRVYVLGGKIIASIMRSSDSDFRANFKLGGKAELIEPSDEIVSMVRKITPELMADFVGIDFVFDHGRPYLNEIEDVVGTRMLYELTDMDPAKMYIDYISRCIMRN